MITREVHYSKIAPRRGRTEPWQSKVHRGLPIKPSVWTLHSFLAGYASVVILSPSFFRYWQNG